MSAARRLTAQGALFTFGAAATLGCWVVVLIDLLAIAIMGWFHPFQSRLVLALGGLAPAFVASFVFVRAAREARSPAAIAWGPGAALLVAVAALLAFGR